MCTICILTEHKWGILNSYYLIYKKTTAQMLNHCLFCFAHMQDEASNFGLEWEELLTQCETAHVVLPDTLSPCSDEEMVVLRNSYDPLASCNDYGISTFMNVKMFITTCRQQRV